MHTTLVAPTSDDRVSHIADAPYEERFLQAVVVEARPADEYLGAASLYLTVDVTAPFAREVEGKEKAWGGKWYRRADTINPPQDTWAALANGRGDKTSSNSMTLGITNVCPPTESSRASTRPILGRHHRFDFLDKRRNTLLDRVPHLLEIDPEVLMDKPVPHPGDLSPRHLGSRPLCLI